MEYKRASTIVVLYQRLKFVSIHREKEMAFASNACVMYMRNVNRVTNTRDKNFFVSPNKVNSKPVRIFEKRFRPTEFERTILLFSKHLKFPHLFAARDHRVLDSRTERSRVPRFRSQLDEL